jgi:hypothetical protein
MTPPARKTAKNPNGKRDFLSGNTGSVRSIAVSRLSSNFGSAAPAYMYKTIRSRKKQMRKS